MKILKIFLLVIIISTSCSRYEDGPDFSLRSREVRLCKTWKVESVVDLRTNTDMTSNYADWTETFQEDGTYYNIIAGNRNDGKWEFKGKNEIIILQGTLSPIKTILRLTNKELWLFDLTNEWHYIPE